MEEDHVPRRSNETNHGSVHSFNSGSPLRGVFFFVLLGFDKELILYSSCCWDLNDNKRRCIKHIYNPDCYPSECHWRFGGSASTCRCCCGTCYDTVLQKALVLSFYNHHGTTRDRSPLHHPVPCPPCHRGVGGQTFKSSCGPG